MGQTLPIFSQFAGADFPLCAADRRIPTPGEGCLLPSLIFQVVPCPPSYASLRGEGRRRRGDSLGLRWLRLAGEEEAVPYAAPSCSIPP